jgi:hypothetical protein
MHIEKYVQNEQKKISDLVTSRFPGYYLTGGTALSFYFRHRFSEDLDFFSQNYFKKTAEEIMAFISDKTGYKHLLVFEQNKPALLPIRMYQLRLKRGIDLKIDIVQDPHENIGAIKDGLHSVKDIYCRKLFIVLNPLNAAVNQTGREVSTSRQESKDVYDIYYLSKNFEPLSEFYPKYFSPIHFDRLDSWYRSLEKMDMIIDLSERVKGTSPRDIFKHLDVQIIRELPLKLGRR